MLFRELTLHDVGVYRGRQVIPLATTLGRPVTLVGGLNGCGKTTFLDSLQLVLYGNRARCSDRGKRSYEDYLRSLINHKAAPADGAAIGLAFDVEREGATHRYTINRSWREVGKRIRETLDVYVDNRRSVALSDGWAEHIEELLPLEIAGLFFFDGEKIEALADPERATSVIETAVHSLLGIGTLERLRTDLVALQRRQVLPGDNADADLRAKDLEREAESVQTELDRVSLTRGRLEVKRNKAERDMHLAEEAFLREGGDLYEQRTQLEAEHHSAQAAAAMHRDELRRLAEGALPFALVGELTSDLGKQFEREESEQQSVQFLEALKERDAWLLDQVPVRSRPKLEKLLTQDREQRVMTSDTYSYLHLTSSAWSKLQSLDGAVAHDRNQAKNHIAALAEAEERLVHLEQKLAGVPAQDAIAARLEEREDRRLELARLEGMVTVADDEHQRLIAQRDGVRAQLDKAEGDQLRGALAREDVQRVVDHSSKVRDILSELRHRLIVRHLGRIEVATLDAFTRLMHKRDLVTDLRIDPETFALTLRRSDGSELEPNRLSAGERQLLAVALLWGLARVAGGRIPTVIDTPLGRLDSRHRERLVDIYFPQAGQQVLLLSTDEEIDQELLSRLAPAISHTYLLEHDRVKHETTVVSGYWWPVETTDVA